MEELDEGNYIFCTNTQTIGVYEKDKMICYKSIHDKNDDINELKLSHNLFSEVLKVPFTSHKYKMAINLKQKKIYKK